MGAGKEAAVCSLSPQWEGLLAGPRSVRNMSGVLIRVPPEPWAMSTCLSALPEAASGALKSSPWFGPSLRELRQSPARLSRGQV